MSDKLTLLNDDNFSSEIASGLFLVDFYADWCGPCRMMAPVLDEVDAEYGDKLTVAKVDVDANQRVAAKFQITSIPTLIVLKDGQEVARSVGMKDKAAIKQMLDGNL